LQLVIKRPAGFSKPDRSATPENLPNLKDLADLNPANLSEP